MHAPPAGFELIELGRTLTDKEMDEMVNINRTSLANETLFQSRIRELSWDEQDAWIRKHWLHGPLTEPRYKNFAIRDLSTNALVGWTGLQYPATQTEAEKQRTIQARADMSDALGPDGQAFLKFFDTEAKTMVSRHGYDPEKHFLHADYQKKGLGTWLTEYANDIADQAGAATFVMARPKAWKMFHDTGFQLLDELVLDVSPYGGEKDVAMRYFRRDPPSAQ